MEPVRRLVRNTKGRDFIVGDIHGCFSTLEWLMTKIGFDDTKDRLFTTGNMIGNGPENHRAIEFINLHWFHPVLGSNEYRFEDYWQRHPQDRQKMSRYGSWTELLHGWQLAQLAEYFAKLPVAMEVVTGRGLFGIVHGDVSTPSWRQFVSELRDDNHDDERCAERRTYQALFGRERYVKKSMESVQDIPRVYVGHSPVKHVTQYGNVFYVDTGCAYGNTLTAMNLGTDETYTVSPVTMP